MIIKLKLAKISTTQSKILQNNKTYLTVASFLPYFKFQNNILLAIMKGQMIIQLVSQESSRCLIQSKYGICKMRC